ncbi:hypothetical protein BIV25_08625 [Streptomyces sp. MUSC 14]|uniref:hypothetical protein n=1 Tax=Streptomyces sp. MUSC 14 TaxID=1354889 RepID=UPI0008F575B7|nr:hypothetical protein [Streptomyces sp. MUSC 14]OIJ99899.1 hypothetical protein BIV25_08625 [Streptomyces sp. MUSC 14]
MREHAVAGLEAELRQWAAMSRAGGPLEKHRSQLDAVGALFGAAVADVRVRLADGRAREVPGRVLDLHHVWDFYRTRFLLRQVRAYRRFLDVADELAWETYGPVVRLAGARPTEPPLVGFSRAASPRAHRRGGAYHDLLPRGGIHTPEGRAAAAGLPFPVIDVPWSFGSHLPALLTVAHEAAHHVDDDCGLGAEIAERVAGAALAPDRRAHWARWAGEAFADVCAAVLCGPAYAAVLADLLDNGDGEGAEGNVDERDFDGPHPPPGARLRLAAAAARLAGHPDAQDRDIMDIDNSEDSRYGDEADAVARTFLTGGWSGLHGLSLAGLLVPERASADTAVPEGARRLLAGGPSRCSSTAGVLAAAALAFRCDPAAYDRRDVGERAVSEALALRAAGTRAGGRPEAQHDERHHTAHRAAGRTLLAALDAASGSTHG